MTGRVIDSMDMPRNVNPQWQQTTCQETAQSSTEGKTSMDNYERDSRNLSMRTKTPQRQVTPVEQDQLSTSNNTFIETIRNTGAQILSSAVKLVKRTIDRLFESEEPARKRPKRD